MAAALALAVAVVALHGGLIVGFQMVGPRVSPMLPVAPPLRAVDVVGPRAHAQAPGGMPEAVTATLPHIDGSGTTSPAVGPQATTRARRPIRPARPTQQEPPDATVASGPAGAPAARPTVPATNTLPPAPRDDAPMPVAPPPIYATRAPAPVILRYALQRGDARGEATLHWQPDGSAYDLVLKALLPQGATLEQRSQGVFDDAGLAPIRLADRRRGRSAQAVNFQRSQGRITFSGPRWEFPLVPGVQDRLSWLVQLVAIASATPLAPGDEVALQVVGARGATSRWRFRVDPDATGPAGGLRLVREPTHLYDLRLELWLDPANGHWPARIRQVQVPGGESLEWVRENAAIGPGGT